MTIEGLTPEKLAPILRENQMRVGLIPKRKEWEEIPDTWKHPYLEAAKFILEQIDNAS